MVATLLGIAHLRVLPLFHAPLQKEGASQVSVGRCYLRDVLLEMQGTRREPTGDPGHYCIVI